MAIYEKIFNLFKLHINDDCDKDTTRKLLSPILMFMDLYEKERTADLIHEIFQQACVEFQVNFLSTDIHKLFTTCCFIWPRLPKLVCGSFNGERYVLK